MQLKAAAREFREGNRQLKELDALNRAADVLEGIAAKAGVRVRLPLILNGTRAVVEAEAD